RLTMVIVSVALLQLGYLHAEDKDEPRELKRAGHWPGWRGPNQDNISTESGLLKKWPGNEPPFSCKVQGIGQGMSSLAITEGRIFTLGYRDESEVANALDLRSGERLWATRIGPVLPENPLMRWLGQRAPLVDEDRVYAFRSDGELVCLS